MVDKEIINDMVFIAQTTYYVYRNNNDLMEDKSPLLITSDINTFELHKNKEYEKNRLR